MGLGVVLGLGAVCGLGIRIGSGRVTIVFCTLLSCPDVLIPPELLGHCVFGETRVATSGFGLFGRGEEGTIGFAGINFGEIRVTDSVIRGLGGGVCARIFVGTAFGETCVAGSLGLGGGLCPRTFVGFGFVDIRAAATEAGL